MTLIPAVKTGDPIAQTSGNSRFLNSIIEGVNNNLGGGRPNGKDGNRQQIGIVSEAAAAMTVETVGGDIHVKPGVGKFRKLRFSPSGADTTRHVQDDNYEEYTFWNWQTSSLPVDDVAQLSRDRRTGKWFVPPQSDSAITSSRCQWSLIHDGTNSTFGGTPMTVSSGWPLGSLFESVDSTTIHATRNFEALCFLSCDLSYGGAGSAGFELTPPVGPVTDSSVIQMKMSYPGGVAETRSLIFHSHYATGFDYRFMVKRLFSPQTGNLFVEAQCNWIEV